MGSSILAAGVFALIVAASTPALALAQQHVPSDEPWRVFRTGSANVWITTAPDVWLPAVMVAFAILGHIVIYRRLRADRLR